MEYVDLSKDEALLPESVQKEIDAQGMFWPVSVVNGAVFRDGSLTLPSVVQVIEKEMAKE